MSLTIDPVNVTIAPNLPIQPIGDEAIVWTKPGCVQCTATERALTSKGIEHRMLDVTDYPEAIDALRAANLLQMPFVQTATDTWTGFRPDKIDAFVKRAILPSDATREARSPAR